MLVNPNDSVILLTLYMPLPVCAYVLMQLTLCIKAAEQRESVSLPFVFQQLLNIGFTFLQFKNPAECMMVRLHLLFLCALMCSARPPAVFFSRTHGGDNTWRRRPSVDVQDLKLTYGLPRSTRHADGLFTSGYSRLLSQLTAKDYLESLTAKRDNDDLTEKQFPVKRHSDAVFTDKYSRFLKKMAAKKYLTSVLQGKRSVDPVLLKVSISSDSTLSQSTEGSMFHDIITQLPLVEDLTSAYEDP
ncbi:uncharacterized protein LOC114447486 isoform X2 [Parambassis ranga]|uniref:Uncharacterized protein LOC114447486 isoform X2 n=1 Tax=Parambassis ranga TaxID=210632 RepID=A0A6P7JRH9_9TELE|nr:uncharacterized protein LOC114447486 isoform X2 [Parambassis ranga]